MRLANTRVALHVLGALDDHCRSFDGFERLAVGVVLARPLRVDDDPLGSSVAVPLQIIERGTAVAGIYNRSHMYTVRVSARLRCELPERCHVGLESGQARHMNGYQPSYVRTTRSSSSCTWASTSRTSSGTVPDVTRRGRRAPVSSSWSGGRAGQETCHTSPTRAVAIPHDFIAPMRAHVMKRADCAVFTPHDQH